MQHKPFVSISPFSLGFRNCLKKLSPEAHELARKAMSALLLPEIPAIYKFKKMDEYHHGLYEITFGHNREYKMSMQVKGNVAYLRRVGPFREIDDIP
jgi:hypothetical protein